MSLFYLHGGVAEVFALQEEVDFSEGGSLDVRAPPALVHQVVEVARAHGRLGQPLELVLRHVLEQRQVVHHLLVERQVLVRLVPRHRQDFPQRHGE
jgi:hypothetical protein